MTRKILNRFTHPFLSYSFPENIKPSQKLNKKAEKIIQYKKRFLSKTAKAAQNNIIRQSLLSLYLQQNKKNLVKNFDLDNLWLQNRQYQLLQQTLFPLIQRLQKQPVAKDLVNNTFYEQKNGSINHSRQNTFAFREKANSTGNYNTASGSNFKFSGKKVLTLFKKQNKKLSFLFALAQLKLELSKKQAQFINPLYSDYKMRFLERKKLSFFYGNLSKKQLQKIINQAKNAHSRTAEKFLALLESRLDVILYRIYFSESISASRQLIAHSNVLVNGVITRQPGFLLKPGDTISIVNSEISKTKNQIIQKLISSGVCSYLGDLSLKKQPRFLFTNTLKNLYFFDNYPFLPESQNTHTTKLLGLPYNQQQPLVPINKEAVKINWWSPTFHDFYKEKLRIKKTTSAALKRKESLLLKTFFLESKKFRLSPKNQKTYHSIESLEKDLQYNNLFKNLRVRKFLYKERSRKLVRQGLRLNPMKPLHLEVSYNLLTAIFLYSPQKLVFPGSIDLDLVFRELQS